MLRKLPLTLHCTLALSPTYRPHRRSTRFPSARRISCSMKNQSSSAVGKSTPNGCRASIGRTGPQVSGLEKPNLDKLRPELDFANTSGPASTTKLTLTGVKPTYKGEIKPGGESQEVKFPQPASGSQFCIEALNAHDGKNFAAIAELDLLDPAGNPISHQAWTIAYASSQELAGEDGSASNAIDGQTSNFWHSQWKNKDDKLPHRIIIDLGKETKVGGLRYTPRAGDASPGRIKDYQIYIGDGLAK